MRRELMFVVFATGCAGGTTCPAEGAIASARAIDATHVEVSLRCPIVANRANVRIASVTAPLAVHSVEGEWRLAIETAAQKALVTYTVRLEGASGPDDKPITASANFVGVGTLETAEIDLTVDDRYDAHLAAVSALVSIDAKTGVFSEYPTLIPLTDSDGDHLWHASVRVAVDPLRTISTNDDRLGAERVAYAARAVDEHGAGLSKLITFEVRRTSPAAVELPLLSVPAPPSPEGLVTVQVAVDDTPARALSAPKLRVSVGSDGAFDPAFPTTLALADPDGDHIWTATARVRIDPRRKLGGTTSDTFPYVLFVQSGGSDYPAVGARVEAPTEADVQATIRVGNPALVPVTFRVDVSGAYIDSAGTQRGLFPGEAPYLTGEFGVAEDAFGQNAADNFGGGENVVLEMAPRSDPKGVWERILFLPPGRSYGWKVVRCPAGKGCAELNRHVSSSGRAFATVMKNLATENRDAQTHPDVKIVDPRHPQIRLDDGRTVDYSHAQIFGGSGKGLESNPMGLPDGTTLFKQELPDLVVEVGAQPVTTPTIVVGTWRDVNLPTTLGQILLSNGVFDLNPYDYEAGFVGAAPPAYPFVPMPPPEPSPFVIGDGVRDGQAIAIAGAGAQSMSLYAAIAGQTLYLATDATGAGSDHILFVAAEPPAAGRPAPWKKGGSVAFAPSALFLAAENDAAFTGWFRLEDEALLTPRPDLQAGQSGPVLEGTIDLVALFGRVPNTLYLAVAPFASADGGVLYANAQHPASANDDGNIDAGEIAAVRTAELIK